MARENLLLVSRSVIAIQDKYFQVLTNTVLIDFFQFFFIVICNFNVIAALFVFVGDTYANTLYGREIMSALLISMLLCS